MRWASIVKPLSLVLCMLTLSTFIACGGGGDDPPPPPYQPTAEQSDAVSKLSAAANDIKKDLLAGTGDDKANSDRIMSIIMEYMVATGEREKKTGQDPNAVLYLAHFLKGYVKSVVPEFYARYPQFGAQGTPDQQAVSGILGRLGNIYQSVVPQIQSVSPQGGNILQQSAAPFI